MSHPMSDMPATAEVQVARALDDLLLRHPDPSRSGRVEFLRAQYELGLAWVHFEPGVGGLGLPASLQGVVTGCLADLGAPTPGSGDYVGLHQVAAAINAFGSLQQKQRFLPHIFDGTENWCQLFSEPGAGSDLAGLSTLAIADGEEWVVTGQKVWTSNADAARWGILLARSDRDAPKHRGLTFFVCDMTLPGVEVRPLRQADGADDFSEVFLDDVRLPDRFRVGARSQGWAVALTALHSERDGIGEALRMPWPEVEDAWRSCKALSRHLHVVMRDRVVSSWIDARVIELLRQRLLANQGRDGSTALGSLLKLAQGGANQRAASLVVDLMGLGGQVGFDYDAARDRRRNEPPLQMLVIRSRANTIEGGTDEIQRNIVGERLLGLPGDVRVDKGIPWRDVPRS